MVIGTLLREWNSVNSSVSKVCAKQGFKPFVMLNESAFVNFSDSDIVCSAQRFSRKIQRFAPLQRGMRNRASTSLSLAFALALAACGDGAADKLARARQELADMELAAARVDLAHVLAEKGDD
ncbi:MAG: hypothetical protein VW891_08880, partial [Novosphingobium sp.]